jgi:hypothetical protein
MGRKRAPLTFSTEPLDSGDRRRTTRVGSSPACPPAPLEIRLNENFRELKRRIHKLDDLRIERGSQDLRFVQALDAVRRAAKHGDNGRDPSPELRILLEKAEALGKMVAG